VVAANTGGVGKVNVTSLLTYYTPHVSGLTIYVQRLMEGLVGRGHRSVVVASRTDPSQPMRESINGVDVVRVPVAFRMSKGPIMPGYRKHALTHLRQADILLVHLPNTPIESHYAYHAARGFGIPLVITYHCDLQLPPGPFNRLVDRGVLWANTRLGTSASRLVAYTDDYANASRVLSRFPEKTVVIPPPIPPIASDPAEVKEFRRRYAPDSRPLVGFAARLAAEKGVEFAVQALELLRRRPGFEKTRLLFAGEHRAVIGEEAYRLKVDSLLERSGLDWTFLGVLNPREMTAFYGACDVTILPSINSTESFGLVQVESMYCGTPVVVSELPGVRVPVKTTGMGLLVPPGDARALADAVQEVILNRPRYVTSRSSIESSFSLERTLRGYEELFCELRRIRPEGACGS